MKLSKLQKEDIEFYLQGKTATDEQMKEFIDFSERGIKPLGKLGGMSGMSMNPIIVGKSRMGLNILLWQEGILDGSVPYFTLLGGEDKPVSRRLVDYMKSQMFGGIDSEIIENCYQKILSVYNSNTN